MMNNFGMGQLYMLPQEEFRSISAENPDGAKGGGASAEPDAGNPASLLGKTWKVRPCITVKAGETVTLADIKGPGIIRHIWITVDPKAYRTFILRVYWDGEKTPSVETPLGDFFCCAMTETVDASISRTRDNLKQRWSLFHPLSGLLDDTNSAMIVLFMQFPEPFLA